MTLSVGDKAPDFTLPSRSGESVTLSKLLGRRAVVVFFYPKDDTPGCTVEACTFRDNYEAFVEAGAEVVGISSDSLESHERFASKHRLPMTLLSDADGKVRALYGVQSLLGLWPGRATFVVDREGVVQHVFVSQLRVGAHVKQALDVVKRISASPRVDAVGG
ncbi:MAG TPA: peroxiredoxin [Polyangiaceae bacterium]|nr:peroxiredoxin [Polyangiaceae bacterium]